MKCPPPPPPRMGLMGPPPLCCGEELVKKMHQEERDMKKICFKEITGMDKPEKRQNPPSEFDLLNCEEINKRKQQMRVS